MNKKKNKNKDSNNRIVFQWLVPIFTMVIVFVVLVSKFGVESETNAKDTVYKKLNSETENYATSINSVLQEIAMGGQGAAAIMEADNAVQTSQWAKYADSMCEKITGIYMVAIVDNMGKGIINGDKSVSLVGKEYYSVVPSTTVVYTKDDGITGKAAFVTMLPFYADSQRAGMIIMYADTTAVERDLPTKEYGGRPSYAIISGDGSIICALGSDSYFTSGDNLFTTLKDSAMSILSLAQVKVRVSKMTAMVFAAVEGDEDKLICTAPIGIDDWQLVTILNQSYANTMIHSEMDSARSLLISLTITICIFLMMLATISIINKIKYKEESKDLADKADTDLLTEVNNKIATERKIQEYMDENPDSQCLMFMFDIDNFKKINDTMGHAFGDEVLSTLGHQLRNEFRVTDIIGRLGGDEFVLFLKNIKSEEQLEREGVRITDFFHQFKAGTYVQYSATASIGAAVFPRDAHNFHDLYQCADKALYEAKRRGKNQLVFYSKELAEVESIRAKDDIDSDKRS